MLRPTTVKAFLYIFGVVIALPFFCLSYSATLAGAAAGISQAFFIEAKEAPPGTIVSLKQGTANTVEVANSDRIPELVGVVSATPLIEIGSGVNTVQVITSGVTTALVSDLNGSIKTGDPITASPIDGVGMKATTSGRIVGIAQVNLENAETIEKTLTDLEGKIHVLKVGSLPIQVNVSFHAEGNENTYLPSFLQDFANTVAGRQVSSTRILASVIAMLLAFVSIAVLLYASVRSSIISIGRNPLSEGAVRKSMLQVGLMVIAILLLSLITVYLILTT